MQRLRITLKQQPELATALTNIISTPNPAQLEPTLTYKLSSLGLIKLLGNKASPSCELYRLYFQNFEGIAQSNSD
ncbi:AAA-like domain-containing protein [Gloeothece verrucosa]|uniref:AAA-like domain-containing protein n=1 Tax=Gloeothece verrucosa TaxID=2546359 RepID=UPI000900559B|nr:AAA-like domain-containing protein [Gloeothece verrucosa]